MTPPCTAGSRPPIEAALHGRIEATHSRIEAALHGRIEALHGRIEAALHGRIEASRVFS